MKRLSRFLQSSYLFIVFFLLLAPIAVLVVNSFNDSTPTQLLAGEWNGFTLRWYTSLFQGGEGILDALGITLLLASLSALLSTVLAVVGCLGIVALKKRSQAVLLGATNIPLENADIVTAVALMLVFVQFGLPFGFWTMLIGHTVIGTPYVVLNLLPRLRRLEPHSYEAAIDLGASPVRAFFKVVLPDIFPGILSGFLMAFTMSMDDFALSYFTKSAEYNTLSTIVYTSSKKGIPMEMYAVATLLFVAVLLVLVAVNRLDKKGKGMGEISI